MKDVGGAMDREVDRVGISDLIDIVVAAGVPDVVDITDATVVTTSTTIAAGQTVTMNNPEIDTYLVGGGHRPGFIYNSNGQAVFTNNGTVTITTDGPARLDGFAISYYTGVTSNAAFINGAGATFTVASTYATPDESPITRGFFAPQLSINFRNDGQFNVSALTGYVIGVDVYGNGTSYPETVTNNGTMSVSSGLDAVGVFRHNETQFLNTGSLTVYGGRRAVGVEIPDYKTGGFVNSGVINVTTAPSSLYGSIGLLIEQNSNVSGGVSAIVNSGTINADYAIIVARNFGLGTTFISSERLENTGTINGDVDLSYGIDTVVNAGVMKGYTYLGGGNDLYDGSAGRHDGIVDGGSGEDLLSGGAGIDWLTGGEGADSIFAGDGDDVVFGDRGADALDGGAGFDTLNLSALYRAAFVDLAAGQAISDMADIIANFEAVIGTKYDDALLGSAAGDTFEGGAGNDTIDARGGDDVIHGGTGDDTLVGGAGSDRFEFSFGDGADTVLDFSAGDSIEIFGYDNVQQIVQQGADTRIVLSATDSLTLRNTQASSLTAANLHFTHKALPADVIAGPSGSIDIDRNMVIAAGETFDITGLDVTSTYFVGTFRFGLSVIPAESVPRLWNGGTIRIVDTGVGAPVAGLVLGDALYGTSGYANGSSAFVNLATGLFDVTATAGDVRGTQFGGECWNLGTLRATANAGNATGFYLPSLTVHNAGNLIVSATGLAIGIDAVQPTFYNSGAITVSGAAGSVGIRTATSVHPAAPAVSSVNSGTITVTATDGVGLSYDITGNVNFWNTGTITAAFAVRAFTYYSGYASPERFTIYNGGALNGRVQLSNGDETLVNGGQITGLIELGGGNDVYDGGGSTVGVTVTGDDGTDQIYGSGAVDILSGGIGDDVIAGGGGADTLSGGAGVDTFHVEVGFGNDTITDFTAGAGGDVIEAAGYAAYQSITQQGADVLIVFGAGDQILLQNVAVGAITSANFRFSATALAGFVLPSAPADTAAPSVPSQPAASLVFNVDGTTANDTLTGSAGNDLIRGYGGNDTLYGNGGDDRIDGGPGTDAMYGGFGNDTYIVDSSGDTVNENAGQGTDTIETGLDNFVLGVTAGSSNVENLTLTGSALTGYGNGLNNVLTGNALGNTLYGNDGNDTIDGAGGINQLNGGAGNDRLIVGASGSGSFIDGGADSDTLVVSGSVSLGGLSGIEAIELQSGANLTLTGSQFGNGLALGTVLSGTGTITVNMSPDQFLLGSTLTVAGGSSISVVFNGSSGSDYVKGVTQATNTMLGGDGSDFLRGGQLADIIDGGADGDKITGFGGADTLTGGGGADQFRYIGQSDSGLGANADHITDFTIGTDRLNFQLFDLDPNVVDVQNPGFSFLGSQAFHATGAAEIRYEDAGNDMVVQVDVNGDGVVDMAIYLNGLHGAVLTGADFML